MDQKRSTPEDSLVALKDHGRIEVRLKEILDSRGMKRNTLARAICCRFEVVNRWCQNELQEIDTDTLAKLCCYFHCSVGDILRFCEPEREFTTSDPEK